VTAPMPTFTAVVEPTLEEQVAGLTATVRRLADDLHRTGALADIYKACATTQTARAEAAEAELESAVAESRRDKQRCRELAAGIDTRDLEIDRLQRENARLQSQIDQREKWRPWNRIGNQL